MNTLDNLVIEYCLACERPPMSGLRRPLTGTHPCDMCQGHQGKRITGHWPLMRHRVTSHQHTDHRLHALRGVGIEKVQTMLLFPCLAIWSPALSLYRVPVARLFHVDHQPKTRRRLNIYLDKDMIQKYFFNNCKVV